MVKDIQIFLDTHSILECEIPMSLKMVTITLGEGLKDSEENLSWLSSHPHYISQRPFQSKRLMLAAPPIPHSPLLDAWRGLLVSLVQCRAGGVRT